MDLPELVRDRLDGESVLTTVDLGGEDRVVVTPTRTLVYRAEGLLSDESVEAFPLDADRLDLRSGRRKTTFVLGYVDGKRDFTVPSSRASDVLSPVLGGLLRAADIVAADESVRGAYRFSELTLVVTDRRLVRHVGGSVWDEEFAVAPFADLTGLGFEGGSVGTEISLAVDSYPQRFKVPNEHAGSVRKTLQDAVFAFHGVDSMAEFEAAVAEDEETEDELAESGFTRTLDDDEEDERPFADLTAPELERDRDRGGDAAGDEDPTPAAESRTADGSATRTVEGPTSETATTELGDDAVAARLDALEAAVERQSDLIQRQQATIEQLIEELRRGR